jgi:glycosyltransferase involved in cell wall biosynthesis
MPHSAVLPFVSVIVPVYNGARCLPACIEGILHQSYPREAYEILIVDNGSTDDTQAIATQYPVRLLVENAVQTSYAARNAGIRAAKGDLIAFTDADCRPRPEWLQQSVAAFADDTVGCVAGGIVGAPPSNWVEEELVRRGWLSEEVTLRHAYLPYAQTANAIYRRSVFQSVGVFEEAWPSGGDADLSWRMQMRTPYIIRHVPAAVVEHHHRSSLTSLLKQTMKWGQGKAQLEDKYDFQKLDTGLGSFGKTILGLMKSLGAYGLRRMKSFILRKPFSDASSHPVSLIVQFGFQLGLFLGRYGRNLARMRGW